MRFYCKRRPADFVKINIILRGIVSCAFEQNIVYKKRVALRRMRTSVARSRLDGS